MLHSATRALLVSTFLVAAAGCAPDEPATIEPATTEPASTLEWGLAAHGGTQQWGAQARLSYTFDRGSGPEKQTIDLWNRRVRWDGPDFTLGFDGDSAWVAPDPEAFGTGDPLFFSSLYFYFYAMPFVLADPGTVHEDLGIQHINGQPYRAVKVTYEPGTGASPDDAYIAHFDPDTGMLRYLLYTVTFMSGEPSERYSALEYPEWQMVDGLLVPGEFVGRRWYADGDSISGERYRLTFNDVAFGTTTPPDSLFVRP